MGLKVERRSIESAQLPQLLSPAYQLPSTRLPQTDQLGPRHCPPTAASSSCGLSLSGGGLHPHDARPEEEGQEAAARLHPPAAQHWNVGKGDADAKTF